MTSRYERLLFALAAFDRFGDLRAICDLLRDGPQSSSENAGFGSSVTSYEQAADELYERGIDVVALEVVPGLVEVRWWSPA